MKYTIIIAACLLLGCFAINSSKKGLDTIQQAQSQKTALLANLDK